MFMCTLPRNGKGVVKLEQPVLSWWRPFPAGQGGALGRWFLGLQGAGPSPLAGEEPNGITVLCFVLYSPGKASLSSLGIKILV